MVMEVLTLSSGIPCRSASMSLRESMATPTSNLSCRHRIVGVVADLSRKVEGDRKPRLSLLKQIMEPPVGLLGRPETCVLSHGPQAASVHGRLHAAGKRVTTWKSEPIRVIVIGKIQGGVEAFDLDVRAGPKLLLPLRRARQRRPKGPDPPRIEGLLQVF
jgi:hypothetical protein